MARLNNKIEIDAERVIKVAKRVVTASYWSGFNEGFSIGVAVCGVIIWIATLIR